MSFTELTQETIERDFCPRCIHYVDKQFIFRDCDTVFTIHMGKLKDCKFHTDDSWVCNYEEQTGENT